MKRVLLLGGGHAHLHVLRALARDRLTAKVVMITPYPRQLYSGMVPGLVAGHYGVDACAVPLAPLAAAAGVELVPGAVVAVDAATRVVTLADGREAEYDLLSIDTGAGVDRDAIPGAREHGLFVRPLEAFVRHVEGVFALAAERALQVVVVGGGAAGVELAMAFAHRLRGVGDGASRVALVTGGEAPPSGFPARVVDRAKAALTAQGVTVYAERCASVEPGQVRLASGTIVPCDAPIIATGVVPPAWCAGSGLALDDAGYLATGPTLQSRSHENVFAAGDVAGRPDAPRPHNGVHAVRAGPPLAANLRRAVLGQSLMTHVPQRRALLLLSCGDRRAIASWGEWCAAGRWAWTWKDWIDRRFVAGFVDGFAERVEPR